MAECDSDFFGMIERINGTGTPDAVAKAYHAHLRDSYWKAHDLRAVIATGSAGILYCLAHCLRSEAKAMAYDVGSFTWPGWEEPGIDPTVDDLAFGRKCAGLNLNLAIELNKPTEKVASAHWLVGAHALAAADWPLAVKSFEAGAAMVAVDSPLEIYLRGCAAVARIRCDAITAAAREELNDAINRLKAAIDDDAKTFFGQLVSIEKLYQPAERGA